MRATGRPWGAATTQTTTPSITPPPSRTTPSFPSFPIFRILVQLFPKVPQFQNKALYQHIYGTSQLYFPLLLDRYRDVVLAFSLYKLVSDRRIWTPIKPRFDEGIKELR